MTARITDEGRVTARPATFHPAVDGIGKWHSAALVTRVAACGSAVELDLGPAIGVDPGTAWSEVHPIVCRRCLARRAGGSRVPAEASR